MEFSPSRPLTDVTRKLRTVGRGCFFYTGADKRALLFAGMLLRMSCTKPRKKLSERKRLAQMQLLVCLRSLQASMLLRWKSWLVYRQH